MQTEEEACVNYAKSCLAGLLDFHSHFKAQEVLTGFMMAWSHKTFFKQLNWISSGDGGLDS
jgi:hypothetical protein